MGDGTDGQIQNVQEHTHKRTPTHKQHTTQTCSQPKPVLQERLEEVVYVRAVNKYTYTHIIIDIIVINETMNKNYFNNFSKCVTLLNVFDVGSNSTLVHPLSSLG